MKNLYNKLIPASETPHQYLISRVEDKMFVRHLVRYIYKKKGLTLKQVAKEEGKLTGVVPHHSTIINSIQEIEKLL